MTTTSDDQTVRDRVDDLMRDAIADVPRWVFAFDAGVAGVGAKEVTARYTDAPIHVIAGARGTGPLSPEDEAALRVIPATGDTMMDGIRAWNDALDHSPTVAEAIARFDPGGDARVMVGLTCTAADVAGRPVFGARRSPWNALEDKTTIDALWDELDVPRSPSRVVAAEPTALRAAHDALIAAGDADAGLGCVWVADNRTGWHGGGQYARWVRTEQDAAQAIAFFAEAAHTVRVMPFLDGRPCSIHGIVFDDHVVALRPCEMIVYRTGDGTAVGGRSDFAYGGSSTAWEPPAADRQAMRTLAKRVGAHLRDAMAFRGVFTIDGVLTVDGFRPTELNPRYGAAIGALARGTGIPLYLLHLCVIERPDLDWRPAELETFILGAADEHLSAATWHVLEGTPVTDLRAAVLHERGDGLRLVEVADATAAAEATDESIVATVQLGPSGSGGYLRIDLRDHPRGRAVAPFGARAFAAVSDAWDLGLPRFRPAPDVR